VRRASKASPTCNERKYTMSHELRTEGLILASLLVGRWSRCFLPFCWPLGLHR
jgi:hypothetical protein